MLEHSQQSKREAWNSCFERVVITFTTTVKRQWEITPKADKVKRQIQGGCLFKLELRNLPGTRSTEQADR